MGVAEVGTERTSGVAVGREAGRSGVRAVPLKSSQMTGEKGKQN